MSHRRSFMKTVGISSLLVSTATADTLVRPTDSNSFKQGDPYLVLVSLETIINVTSIMGTTGKIQYTLVRSKVGSDILGEAIVRAQELHPTKEITGVYANPVMIHFEQGYIHGSKARLYQLKLNREAYGIDAHYVVAKNVKSALEALTVKATVQGIEKMGFWVDGDD